jgi:acyl-coenzyme A synthetase/AMP-(fatty) acid ligase
LREALGPTFGRTISASSYTSGTWLLELFTAWANGGAVHLLDEETTHDPASLSSYLLQQRITHAALSPSLLTSLPRRPHPDLGSILTRAGGKETAALEHWAKELRLYTLYWVGGVVVSGGRISTSSAPLSIGRPLSQREVQVLDSNQRPLPPLAPGHLWIRHTPTKPTAQHQLLRTGERARWSLDGELEYLGMESEIEPATLTTALLEVPRVEEGFVEWREVGGRRVLVGYAYGSERVEEGWVRSWLESSELPLSALPPHLIFLPEPLPRTADGEVDSTTLPTPHLPSSPNLIRPRNLTEEKIHQIWAIVLGLDPESFGINESFFQLGGDSISSIQVRNSFRTCPINLCFNKP